MSLILPQEVEIMLRGGTITKYEKLGYNIPRTIDKNGKLKVKINQKIKVHILDLSDDSDIIVKAFCDCCHNMIDIKYTNAIKSISVIKFGKILCEECRKVELSKHKTSVPSVWSNKQYALEQLNNFIKNNGTLKGFTVNNKDGNRINVSLKNNDYNIEELCDELGYDYLELNGLYYPVGYLDNFDNFKLVVQEFINENSYFPTIKNLKFDLHIPESVYSKHGTISKIQKLIMGDNSNLLEDDNGFYNRSHYEYMVAQFLIHNNVNYLREQFPFPKPYNMLRSDFTFYDSNNNNFHVELWGFYETDNVSSRSCQYNLKRIQKEKLYSEYNIKLISINPETFNTSMDEIQDRLSFIFEPYLKLKLMHIDNKYMINPNKLSDDEILERFMEYSKDSRFLPKQYILQKEIPTLFNEMNRRYGNQNNFAKKFNKLTYSKVGLWDMDLIIQVFKHIQATYGYVLRMNKIRELISCKSDDMLIGFNDGLKKFFDNIIDGYLFYYDYCLKNKIVFHDNDISYLKDLSTGHYFNLKNATEKRKNEAGNILGRYYELAYFKEVA